MKRLVMKFGFACLTVATHATVACPRSSAVDWLTHPSKYTHVHETGARTNQFANVEAPPLTNQSAITTSGYTHYRSTLQGGQSADNYNRVNQWGPPVRPYGEWEFPYRPYSAPYQAWGAPYAGLNIGGFPGAGNFPSNGYPGNGYPGSSPGNGLPGGFVPNPVAPGGGIPGQPNQPYPADPNGLYPVPPWYGGYQPDYSQTPTLNDKDFFRSPTETTGTPVP